jgi:hypothetical protein
VSLLGVLSEAPFLVRAGIAQGRGWSCRLAGARDAWSLSTFRGAHGVAAVHSPLERWLVFSACRHPASASLPIRGNAFVGVLAAAGGETGLRLGFGAAFAYEPSLGAPADPLFADVASHIAGTGSLGAPDVAFAQATRGVCRALGPGAASFLYADSDRLYAYAIGLPLVVGHLPGALVVGSPDLAPAGSSVFRVPSGALLSMAVRPQLRWATTSVVQ